MTKNEKIKEIREAISAGNHALQSLRNVESQLSSAGNWGLLDIFGGGLITSMVKHSKLNNAQSEMEESKRLLKIMQKELRDIDIPSELNIDIGGFLTFADFFFDGLIADWLVQSKISDAKKQVASAIAQVSQIINELHRWEQDLIQDDTF